MQSCKKFVISCLYKAQHVSGDTPPIIRSTAALAASGFAYVKGCWTLWLLEAVSIQQPQRPTTFYVVLLMMGGVSPETC
jgi:hypothetical protein